MNQDGKVLHFLKEFPAQFILTFLFLVCIGVYVIYQIQFLERILDLIAGGLLTTLIGTRKPTTTVNTDSVNTPNLNTASMDNSTVNVNSENKEDL